MQYLIDTDIFIKTAHLNLLPQIAPALQTETSNLFYTREILNKIKPGNKGIVNPIYEKYGKSLLRIQPFLNKCSELKTIPNKEFLNITQRLKKLDTLSGRSNNGEILLCAYSLTHKKDESLIVTGDKAFIRLVKDADSNFYSDIQAGLQNRFITFEFLILKMLQLNKDNFKKFIAELKEKDYGKDSNLKRIFESLANQNPNADFKAIENQLKNELNSLSDYLAHN